MKTKINFLIQVVLLFAMLITSKSFASEPKKAANFRLKDYNGKEYQLSDFKNSKATVVMFIATQCPVSNAYNPRMAKLYADYKDKGVTFIGVNSNEKESVEEIKEHAKSNKLDFLILKDPNNVVADKFDASVTPETYVLDANMNILYHGRIDDNRRESDVKTKDLRAALDEVLTGKKVEVSETKAFGCSIKRAE
ncbi:MAG: thioredoxin family protein [Ignavibacteriales bacterium]|nr:thioredoxin family protein [Ignavibacteriales bacterium]